MYLTFLLQIHNVFLILGSIQKVLANNISLVTHSKNSQFKLLAFSIPLKNSKLIMQIISKLKYLGLGRACNITEHKPYNKF